MARTEAQLANLRKPWQKGECGNPRKINNGRQKNRAKEYYQKLFGKKKATQFYGITEEELDYFDSMLETLTISELTLITKADDTPMYLKNYAMAILVDLKNGKTATIDRVRANRHGLTKRTIEVTGADGQPLVQDRNLTASDVAEIMREYDKQYKNNGAGERD